ncbi:MAG: endo-1,4-beta-xylanase, partial [Cytophagaceae bacterium]
NIRANTNANCLRIVVGNGYTPLDGTGSNWSTTDNAWQTAVQRCIDNDMIPMLEVHNVLGSNNPQDLQAVAQWWASKAEFLTRPEIARYVLINIANEWGDWFLSSPTHNPAQTVWRDAYINAIQTIRNAGIKTTLIVDAPGYGQDNRASTILNHGAAVLDADPEKNIQFSVHMYCEWRVGGNSNITTHLPAIKNAGLSVNVGEFAFQHATDGSCDIDEDLILSTCQQNGIGWLAWSWKGNGSPLEYMDLSHDWAGTNLTPWGDRIVNGLNGTNTSETASVFLTQSEPEIVGTPASCVITAPHVNAYYQTGSNVTINVYARDIGGTHANGSVTKVEFYNGTVKLGEDASSPYSFSWTNVPAGTHTITARATDNDGNISTSAGVVFHVGADPVTAKGMSSCNGKYLGNIIAGSIRNDYNTFWNGVTAENGCKWGSVEPTRGNYNWGAADRAYNHALLHNMPFRYHALAWGSQYPNWITNLSPAEFKVAMESYMAAVAQRYPYIDQIDVLNEALRTHASGTDYFRNGLGGANGGVAPDNNTGYDWVVWLFRKAREYFPNSKLVLNDYGLENDPTAINEMLDIVKVLRDRNLIDGFGTQAHTFNVDGLAATTLNNRLNLMANGGVPIYVTELDLTGSPQGNNGTEATQLTSYQNLFPVYWNHAHVAGISLWGYVEGETWRVGTGLLRADGSEKPAMTWLKEYMSERPDVGYPFCGSGGSTDPTPNPNLLVNGEFDLGTLGWDIQNNSGANGTMSVVQNGNMSGANALRICPTNPGTANWHVQVRQDAPFEAGKKYTISFMSKADATRFIDVGIQQEGGDWTSYFGGRADLTTSNQEFTFDFEPTVSDPTAKLKFYVGANPTCVFIDKVEFREVVEEALEAKITAEGNTSFCEGGSVILNANTGTDYQYQWRRN